MRGKAVYIAVLLIGLVAIPAVVIARIRSVYSSKPRVHVFMDMDVQPKLKPQQVSPMFADRLAQRPPVPETIARGELRTDMGYFTGKVSDVGRAQPAATTNPSDQWLTQLPLPLTDEVIRRGRQRFDIFCAPCHGFDGGGTGMVAVRAAALQEAAWVKPTSLHSEQARGRPVGHLFNTISEGIATMPSYAAQIAVEDRWAIVAYIRALQRSQNAKPEDVPAGVKIEDASDTQKK
jgi:mono/diheme cytochrome c family protein